MMGPPPTTPTTAASNFVGGAQPPTSIPTFTMTPQGGLSMAPNQLRPVVKMQVSPAGGLQSSPASNKIQLQPTSGPPCFTMTINPNMGNSSPMVKREPIWFMNWEKMSWNKIPIDFIFVVVLIFAKNNLLREVFIFKLKWKQNQVPETILDKMDLSFLINNASQAKEVCNRGVACSWQATPSITKFLITSRSAEKNDDSR